MHTADKIRNVGILGHSNTGKTSMSDAILYTAGVVNRLGRVIDGTSVSDFLDEERERKLSIRSALMHFEQDGTKVNLIDTPGYADFIGGVCETLRVVDGAVVAVNGFTGVEIGTLKVWRMLKEQNVPRLIFINQLDNEHADFERVLADIREKLDPKAVPLYLPVKPGTSFNGYISVLERKCYTRQAGDREDYQVGDVPADLQDAVDTAALELMEVAAEGEDALLEKYLDGKELTPAEVNQGLVKGVLAGKIFPVLVGAAGKLIGVQALKDAMVNLLPSPAARPETTGTSGKGEEKRPLAAQAPFSAFVFKTFSEEHLGDIYFFKVFSGEVKAGQDVLNSTRDGKERMGQLFVMQGKERKEVALLSAGDIGAVVKLKNTHTGDTLCATDRPIQYPAITYPEPIIDLAMVSAVKGIEEKLAMGLSKLVEEDPTFKYKVDGELRQTIINGMGEVQIEMAVKRLRQKFNVDIDLVKPNIPYRETIRKKADGHKKYKKQSGGRGQYGDAYLHLAPKARGEGYEFVNGVVGGAIPGKFIPAVEKGVVEAMEKGVLAGYKVVDLQVELYDGSYHDVDSSEMAFKRAGSMAFKEGFLAASPVLLEPIYDVEVRVPDTYMGDVMGDLSGRRGKISGMDSEGGLQVVRAKVPLPELFRYSTTLRSLTQGAGEYTRKFSHYEEVPRELAEKIIASAEKKADEDEE